MAAVHGAVGLPYVSVLFSNDNVSQLFAPEYIRLNGVDIRIGANPDYQTLLREGSRMMDDMAQRMPSKLWAHRARELITGMVHWRAFTRRSVQEFLHRHR